MAKGLNLDEILATLEQEKTAEEIFAENALSTEDGADKSNKDTEEDKNDSVDENKDETDNEDEEKDAEKEGVLTLEKAVENFNEWTTVKVNNDNYMYHNVKEAAEIMEEKDLPMEEKIAKLKGEGYLKEAKVEDVAVSEKEILKKVAANIEDQGKLLAQSFYAELNKLSAKEVEGKIDDSVSTEEEKEANIDKEAELDSPEVRILTGLYNQYYGEE